MFLPSQHPITRQPVTWPVTPSSLPTPSPFNLLPAAPSFSPGDLVKANLATGNWSIIASDIISGTISIVINQSGTRAYLTQFFGSEGQCTGKLSWVDINSLSATYLNVTDILTGLCGPHDLDVRADERQFYVALVDGRQLIRVDLWNMIYLPVVSKNH